MHYSRSEICRPTSVRYGPPSSSTWCSRTLKAHSSIFRLSNAECSDHLRPNARAESAKHWRANSGTIREAVSVQEVPGEGQPLAGGAEGCPRRALTTSCEV